MRVMIAGIGGASLGTEIMKCLVLAGAYEIYGCDISPTAFGLYDSHFSRTFLINRDTYLDSVLSACRETEVQWIIPGGEEPAQLLSNAREALQKNGIRLLGNDPSVVQLCSDKSSCFSKLEALGIAIPRTVRSISRESLASFGFPCIVKPSTGSGGSSKVFLAWSLDEALMYAEYIQRCGILPIAQEYIPGNEGEFTVGVLSWPEDGQIAGSIALKRSLDSKLSLMMKERGAVISSGYSQGYIGDFPNIRQQAEKIARSIVSRGPMNIQGRVRKGEFIPFEINPRFSASAYLRAMAGFNEIDILLQHLSNGCGMPLLRIQEGWYLRTLSESYVPGSEILQ